MGQYGAVGQEVDAVSLASGRYEYLLTLTLHYADGTVQSQIYENHIEIVNRATSPFGSRFWPQDIDQLADLNAGDGVSLIRGTTRPPGSPPRAAVTTPPPAVSAPW